MPACRRTRAQASAGCASSGGIRKRHFLIALRDCLYVDDARGTPVVAHVMNLRGDETRSDRVARLETVADVPLSGLTRLAHHALCAAAEAGAARAFSSFQHPALIAGGMQGHGTELVLDALSHRSVPAALRSTR